MKLGLFAGHHYYPEGGANDFRAFGETVDELKEMYKRNGAKWSKAVGTYSDPWGQIVDMETMKILWNSYDD